MADLKATVEKYYDEIWRKGNVDALDDLLADDYVDHNPTPGFGTDKESAKALAGAITGATKDTKLDVLGIVIEGEHVAAHWTTEWTQVGDFMGTIPADGKRISMRGHDFFQFKNGKIAEIWHLEDMFGVMAQLGLVPGM